MCWYRWQIEALAKEYNIQLCSVGSLDCLSMVPGEAMSLHPDDYFNPEIRKQVIETFRKVCEINKHTEGMICKR